MTHFGHVCYGYNGAINDWIGSMAKTRSEMSDEADTKPDSDGDAEVRHFPAQFPPF